jgi:hypothetical protein
VFVNHAGDALTHTIGATAVWQILVVELDTAMRASWIECASNLLSGLYPGEVTGFETENWQRIYSIPPEW